MATVDPLPNDLRDAPPSAKHLYRELSEEPAKTTDIAEALGYSRDTVYQSMTVLIEKGYATTVVMDDGRCTYYKLV